MEVRVKEGFKIHVGKRRFCVGDLIPSGLIGSLVLDSLLKRGSVERVDVDEPKQSLIEGGDGN